MSWEVIISIFISIVAVWVAMSSKNEASKASRESLKIQKRMEVNQFYPIIDLDIDIDLENQFPILIINNRSDINSASDYTVKYILRIYAENMDVDLQGAGCGRAIPANSKEYFLSNDISEYVRPTFRTRFMNKSAGIEGRERR